MHFVGHRRGIIAQSQTDAFGFGQFKQSLLVESVKEHLSKSFIRLLTETDRFFEKLSFLPSAANVRSLEVLKLS